MSKEGAHLKKELIWFYQFGAHHIFPDEWSKYFNLIPDSEKNDLISAYYKRLTSTDPEVRKQAAKAWAGWEAATVKLRFDPVFFFFFH